MDQGRRGGEWGFALDVSAAGYGGYEEDAVTALAASAEVVLFTHTQTIDDFRYYARGALVTMLNRACWTGTAASRTGSWNRCGRWVYLTPHRR